ncbi:MAG TPA: hypothetical protein VF322_01630 [Gammaproteobacteria bacterium]
MEQDKRPPRHGEEPEAAADERLGSDASTPPPVSEDLGVARDLGIDEDEALLLFTMGC